MDRNLIAKTLLKAAKMVVADASFVKLREVQQKCNELKKEKNIVEEDLKKAWEIIAQFRKDVEDGTFKIEGETEKDIAKKKKYWLKQCDKPTAYFSTFKYKDYPRVEKVNWAFTIISSDSKEPERLQKRIDQYEEQLRFMEEDLAAAKRLRDNLPPEFEDALKNVYEMILEDCKNEKERKIQKAQKMLDQAWDIYSNPNNPNYKKQYYERDYLNIDKSRFSSPEEYIAKVNEVADSIISELRPLQGNAQGLIDYVDTHKDAVRFSHDYRSEDYAGDAETAIEEVNWDRKHQIGNIFKRDIVDEGNYEHLRDSLQRSLQAAQAINPVRNAKTFFTYMKDRFLDDLSRYCSEIISVERATVGIKGNIDAIVTAPNGRFKVQAVPAGGYNIQRYHYRVLINRLKD